MFKNKKLNITNKKFVSPILFSRKCISI